MSKPSLHEIVGWDTGTWGKAIPLWERAIKGRKDLRCLEIGANRGGLSLWLSMQNEVKSVLCSDLSDAEEKASPLHERYPAFSKKISYRNLNILDSDLTETYDLIVFKSVIGACDRLENKNGKDLAMENIFRTLSKDGILLFAENMQGHWLHRWFRKKFVPWSEGWSYCTIEEWCRWLLSYRSHEIYFDGFLSVLGRNEWQKRVLSKTDEVFISKISDKNKYMCYGFAMKA